MRVLSALVVALCIIIIIHHVASQCRDCAAISDTCDTVLWLYVRLAPRGSREGSKVSSYSVADIVHSASTLNTDPMPTDPVRFSPAAAAAAAVALSVLARSAATSTTDSRHPICRYQCRGSEQKSTAEQRTSSGDGNQHVVTGYADRSTRASCGWRLTWVAKVPLAGMEESVLD